MRDRSALIAASLDELATTLGLDAQLEAALSGDRDYHEREGHDLEELFERYWDTRYRLAFASAVLALPHRPAAFDELVERAHERYLVATADADGAARYRASVAKRALHAFRRRVESWRYFDGTHARPLALLTTEEVQARVAAEAAAASPRSIFATAAEPARDVRMPALEAAIEDDPYDVDRYSVLADALQQAGDRRGELIALQIAAEHDYTRRAKVEAFLERHADEFLGPLARHAHGHETRPISDALRWRFGYLHAVRVACGMREVRPADVVRDVLVHPSGRFVAELVVATRHPQGRLQPVIDLLAARAPRALRVLALHADGDRYGPPQPPDDVAGAWPAFARLRELQLHGPFRLGAIALPAATRVTFALAALDDTALDQIAHAHWPMLEHLQVTFRRSATGAAAGARAWLAALDHPTLTSLALDRCEFADELAEMIARSPVRHRLRRLSLASSPLTALGARALARAGLDLDLLDITACQVPFEDMKPLRRIARTLECLRQHEPRFD